MTELPSPETMLLYASILEKPQYAEKNGAKYQVATGEIVEAACAALRLCAAHAAASGPSWGQIVQLLLRAMDTSPKSESAAALAERTADAILALYGTSHAEQMAEWKQTASVEADLRREFATKIDKLEAVLRPFADFADSRNTIPPDTILTAGSPMARRQITMADCYAAKAVLHGKDGA